MRCSLTSIQIECLKTGMKSYKESRLHTAFSDYNPKMKILMKEFSINFKSLLFHFFMKILTPDWLLGKLSFRSCIKEIYINQEVNKRYVPSFLMLRKELEYFIKAIGNFCITFSNYFPFYFLFFFTEVLSEVTKLYCCSSWTYFLPTNSSFTNTELRRWL